MTTADLTAQAIQEISSIPIEFRIANAVRQANSVTGVYGITGTGKSSLGDTAAEYAYERFAATTMCYATDPGGFGNKRLSLIRLGIMRVWDPTNHVRPFETMELISMGAWPAEILDPDRGYADPNVPLILPRRMGYNLICPQGHEVQRFDNEATLNASNVTCPTCNVITNLTNALRVDKVIIKSKLFAGVGLRIYDSVTAMNDRGLLIELPGMSARGEFSANREGGSALGSADAFRQGTVVYGTGSKSQVGFMQNRSYGWLVNIRQIPDQVVPAIAMFGVEQSRVDDESGGEMLLGPKISGNARTAAVGGWLGNLLHASKEPDADGRMRHRLWLTNHIDPRRPDRIPYVAKHRGTPLGMPDYLEDPWDDDPAKRAELAWTNCSLNKFFTLLEDQFDKVLANDTKRFPDAPGLQKDQAEAKDEIEQVSAATAAAASGMDTPVAVTGGRMIGRRGGRTRRPVAVDMPPAAAAPAPAAASGAGNTSAEVTDAPPAVSASTPLAGAAAVAEAPPVHVQQMEASLATAAAAAVQQAQAAPAGNGKAQPAGDGTVSVPAAPVVVQQAPAATAAPPAPPAPAPLPVQSVAAPAPPVAQAPGGRSRIRRVPRPPTS
jgi:hypothetical protein